MYCGTDIILYNMLEFMLNLKNIPHNIVSPTDHCYRSEWCYGFSNTPRNTIFVILGDFQSPKIMEFSHYNEYGVKGVTQCQCMYIPNPKPYHHWNEWDGTSSTKYFVFTGGMVIQLLWCHLCTYPLVCVFIPFVGERELSYTSIPLIHPT